MADEATTVMQGGREADMPRRAFEELPPAAQRALREAEERRRLAEAAAEASRPVEIDGRKGPEPVRYGDWERNGIISDF